MLDKPDKTARLVSMLKAAIPFEVELPASTLVRLRECNPGIQISAREMVSEVVCEPSHGGILCLIYTDDADHLVATSLTHVRVRPTQSFAVAVADYQKHRRKKLRQRQGSPSPLTLRLCNG